MAIGPDGTAWAVGQDTTVTSPLNVHTNGPPLSMRWTSATWQAVPAPGPKAGFDRVTIAPGGAVWAVGGDASGALARTGRGGQQENLPLIVHWDGTAWN
jgi:hypothetical protein